MSNDAKTLIESVASGRTIEDVFAEYGLTEMPGPQVTIDDIDEAKKHDWPAIKAAVTSGVKGIKELPGGGFDIEFKNMTSVRLQNGNVWSASLHQG